MLDDEEDVAEASANLMDDELELAKTKAAVTIACLAVFGAGCRCRIWAVRRREQACASRCCRLPSPRPPPNTVPVHGHRPHSELERVVDVQAAR